MFLNFFRRFLGSPSERMIKQLQGTVAQINAREPVYTAMNDKELAEQTVVLKARLAAGSSLDDILVDAFATVREAARRTLGQRPYDVQLLGGIILHQGRIAEMKTGEGKTLTTTLPVYLNALSGKGVHVVTVNDYLASRDMQWMNRVYSFLGMTTGCIVHGLTDPERKVAYDADITYGTNNEFGFDYLRDNMKFHLNEVVQRPFNYAIVDEADSILIDEARTPLIISGAVEDSSDLYGRVNRLIPYLKKDEHYEKDEKSRQVTLTELGMEYVEELLRREDILTEGNLYDYQNGALVHYVNQCLRAHTTFQRDVDYIVRNDKVVIIDEFTGRMMEGRRYSEGLHQSLEAKEGVTIQMENQTLASITFQNYFRLFPKLAGMTGTAATEATELSDIYKLDVVVLPTNVPCIRKDNDDEVYRTNLDKFNAVAKLIEECQKREQPVLVGTISIEKSEELSALLTQKGIKHQVLNARYHEQEAYIIAEAGRPGAVTIATNMAGRGTDIKLGGNLEMRVAFELQDVTDTKERARRIAQIEAEIEEQEKVVLAAGGLFVIGTERHESRRIDNQLRGRAGRQGDPGASKFFVSLEDDLMRIFGSEKLDGMLVKLGMEEGEALVHPWINKALERAQQRVEARNYDIRKQLLKFDDVMNDQRKVIYEQRREIMSSLDVSDVIDEMRDDVLMRYIDMAIPPESFSASWDWKGLQENIERTFAQEIPVDKWSSEDGLEGHIISDRVRDIVTSHTKAITLKYGETMMRTFQKVTLLRTLDFVWKNHLLALDHLRQGISLRSYAQRDPLNEYKSEAFKMFHDMLDHVREKTITTLSHFQIEEQMQHALQEMPDSELALENLLLEAVPGLKKMRQKLDMKQDEEIDPLAAIRVSRNSACPCGSGKKYKHCHGKL